MNMNIIWFTNSACLYRVHHCFYHVHHCLYRVHQEGIPVLMPYMTKRLHRIPPVDYLVLLEVR